ncbi:MAG: sigma-70 family RNA polymerase sigma factor [Acidobacteria bacterium]|nr:sigma-70 family RNA polymerase sigma factor [Acidobacteriota bacterium]
MRRLESLAEESATLDAYLEAIARFPSLTADEEHAMAARVQARDEDALHSLVGSHLGLVIQYARRYRHLGVSLLDLVHDGNLALIDAARRFDPATHGRFAVYARWWVRQGFLHRMSLAPGTAPAVLDADARANHMVPALRAEMEHACAPLDERREELTADEVRSLHDHWRRSPHMDWLADEDELDIDDLVPAVIDEQEDAVRSALVSDLESALLELDPKERRVLELRLGLADGEPRNLEQVGARLRVSAALAERLSARAVRKLRRQRSIRSSLN